MLEVLMYPSTLMTTSDFYAFFWVPMVALVWYLYAGHVWYEVSTMCKAGMPQVAITKTPAVYKRVTVLVIFGWSIWPFIITIALGGLMFACVSFLGAIACADLIGPPPHDLD